MKNKKPIIVTDDLLKKLCEEANVNDKSKKTIAAQQQLLEIVQALAFEEKRLFGSFKDCEEKTKAYDDAGVKYDALVEDALVAVADRDQAKKNMDNAQVAVNDTSGALEYFKADKIKAAQT
ncbi:MAG: hypothetical protein HUJ68_09925, partial [Clostridia bacterium]|nr:hypothetical protein [Clostridia bacterium]